MSFFFIRVDLGKLIPFSENYNRAVFILLEMKRIGEDWPHL